MQSQAIRTGVIIGVILILIGLAAFFVGSRDAAAPENGTSMNTEDVSGTDTAAASSTESNTPAATAPATSAPRQTGPVAQPAPPAPSPYGATIVYTDTGFEPSRVSVYKGQTVRFVNRSERPMWVASNIHPIHAEYQEKSLDDCAGSTFDQCKSVSTGGHWDFKFNVVGTWGFHNEGKPTDDGEITVLER